jgi:TonB family protein
MRSLAPGRAWLVPALCSTLWSGACATQNTTDGAGEANAALAGARDPNYRPGSRPIELGDSKEDGLVVQSEQGELDQNEVDRVLERSFRKLVSCYDRAGDAQKYVAGQVTLKFQIAPSGAVADVFVADNALGNYAVERCLVVEARKISFPAPRGSKNAEIEYPLRFRSSGEVSVVDWEADSVARDLAVLLPQLGSCGSLGAKNVRATAYVEPGGAVGSVGLSYEEAVDPMAAICVVEQIRGWKLPDDPSHVVRTSFTLDRPAPVSAGRAPESNRRIASKRPARRR